MAGKGEIRLRIFELRRQYSEDAFAAGSDAIYKKVIASKAFQECECVYCYVDCKGEVSTRGIINEAFRLGKRVAVPKIAGDEMFFYYIDGYEDLSIGYFGIMEPTTGKLANEEHALIIVPGVAFDRFRHRIGYGKGFYDRYLAGHKKHFTIGIGFDYQIMEEVPYDENDQLPRLLMTQTAVYGME